MYTDCFQLAVAEVVVARAVENDFRPEDRIFIFLIADCLVTCN